MSSVTTILITGANRGIGEGLVTRYLATPNSVVVATVRDPTDATSRSLETLPKKAGSSLIVLQLDVTSSDYINRAMETLKSTEMGQTGFKWLKEQGIDVTDHVISVEKSTEGIKNIIDVATVETTHGKFLDPSGFELPW